MLNRILKIFGLIIMIMAVIFIEAMVWNYIYSEWHTNILFAIIIIDVILILWAISNAKYDLPREFQSYCIPIYVDISGRRQPNLMSCLKEYLCNNRSVDEKNQYILDLFNKELREWDILCRKYLDSILLWRRYKENLYRAIRHGIIDKDYKVFRIVFTRNHTRYHQCDYVRYAYTATDIDNRLELSLSDMLNLEFISDTSFNYSDEFDDIQFMPQKHRRRTVSVKHRQRILRRDNFTCQLCGAKGPGAGGTATLHVDHKKPFSLGGTDDDNNLWVLCQDCNLGKSNEWDDSQ